jgi:hypothetical protein
MSARIPHLLTRLLTSDDLDALESELHQKALAAGDSSHAVAAAWNQAREMIVAARTASYERRSKLTPSARRKSLGLRYTR